MDRAESDYQDALAQDSARDLAAEDAAERAFLSSLYADLEALPDTCVHGLPEGA